MLLFGQAQSGALQELLNSFVSGVPKFLTAVVIAIVGIIIAKIVAKLIRKAMQAINIDRIGEKLEEIEFIEKSNIKIKISTVISKIVYYFLILFFMVAATDVLGL